MGDENTPGTIVYTIEKTRAAGIQAIGHATNDPNANGSPTAPWSWYYAPNEAYVDVGMTIYFDKNNTDLSDIAKDQIVTDVADALTVYIDGIAMQEKIFRNKLIQIALSVDPNIIDAQLTSWNIDNTNPSVSQIYLEAGDQEIISARSIIILPSTV